MRAAFVLPLIFGVGLAAAGIRMLIVAMISEPGTLGAGTDTEVWLKGGGVALAGLTMTALVIWKLVEARRRS